MSHLILNADAGRIPLGDASVDLVFTSPPYTDARTYGIGAQRDCQTWIDWMLGVVSECCRVSRGLVLVNCAGVTRDWNYQPGPEGLLYRWWARGGRCWRPAQWRRVGIPGSGGKQWLRADTEYVLAFTSCRKAIPWADNTANGHPPKWGPGGEMSHRVSSGTRVNQWGHPIVSGGVGGSNIDNPTCGPARPSHFMVDRKAMLADGIDEIQVYIPPVKANPGNVVNVKVGGGLLGHPMAHENEAPFPVALAEWFIRSHCPPGGIVLDCFGGSGTTAHAADNLGRHCITSDIRFSQCELMRRRLSTPYAKRSRPAKAIKGEMTLFGRESA